MRHCTPDEITALIAGNDDLTERVAALTAERDALAARLAAAERSIVDIHASYRHKLDALRGRIVGTLTGRLERLLETALTAARAEPPRAAVIIERVEIVTEMIAAFVAAERNPS
jgi:hypothetical protein